MYDPLVVDAFIELHPTLVETTPPLPDSSLLAITGAATHGAPQPTNSRSVRLEDIASSAGEAVNLFALAQATSGNLTVSSVAHVTFDHLRRMVPHAFGVLFLYLEATDELAVAYASGDSSAVLSGMRVAVGQRLTGWVAASRTTIRNSDPVLDLGEIAKTLTPRPRSCLSTPLVANGKLAGVLTIYSAQANFFSEEHERIIEAVARQVAPAVNRAESTNTPDGRIAHTEGLHSSSGDSLPAGTCLILFETDSSEHGMDRLAAVANNLGRSIRPTDLVFRRGNRQLAVLSNQMERLSAARLMSQAVESISGVKATVAISPGDGTSVDQLLGSADRNLRDRSGSGDSGRHSIH